MVAQLPIPRIYTKKPGGGTVAAANYVNNNNSAIRYQWLPDQLEGESVAMIEEKLKERFAIMRIMTEQCVDGTSRAMTVSGPGGVGKTYDVDEILARRFPETELDSENADFAANSGHILATGLYRLAYDFKEPGQVIKLDDSDSIFFQDSSLNLLKKLCDTTERRIVSWRTERELISEKTGDVIPRSFEYHGTMIFISNLDFDGMIDKGTKLAPHLEALMTRSNYINMGMRSKKDYLVRMFMLIYPTDESPGLFDRLNLTDEQKQSVVDFIEKNYRILRDGSLRMALKIANMCKAHKETDMIPWQRMALITCCRASHVPPPPLPEEPEVEHDELDELEERLDEVSETAQE